ncbi:DNA repair protein RecO [Bowmanella dokdonensis]|uniref:DNA repair protein RecO n=1 Tax=Bowmanella dokdonensis TaxID=751969 RepID=A0A939ISA8_9ALTE|nr:DNA repair protein RecO [Bowmanella dokdonensis]MBN7826532.1 DNA repair protein RecO [Bowmanella dokdonensis]
MPNPDQSAFVLHRRPYRETSFLVEVFGREKGRQSFVARGVRNSKSANRSLLQPFTPLQLSLSGRHELKNLSQVEALGSAMPLAGNGLFSALYLNELLLRLLPAEMPFESLFDAYLAALRALAAGAALEPLLRTYELLLLSELGYELDFCHDCHSGQPIAPEAFYALAAEQGFFALAREVASQNCFRGQDLLDIQGGAWHKGSLRAAKLINRQALKPLLGDRPLKSRELFLRS